MRWEVLAAPLWLLEEEGEQGMFGLALPKPLREQKFYWFYWRVMGGRAAVPLLHS